MAAQAAWAGKSPSVQPVRQCILQHWRFCVEVFHVVVLTVATMSLPYCRAVPKTRRQCLVTLGRCTLWSQPLVTSGCQTTGRSGQLTTLGSRYTMMPAAETAAGPANLALCTVLKAMPSSSFMCTAAACVQANQASSQGSLLQGLHWHAERVGSFMDGAVLLCTICGFCNIAGAC